MCSNRSAVRTISTLPLAQSLLCTRSARIKSARWHMLWRGINLGLLYFVELSY